VLQEFERISRARRRARRHGNGYQRGKIQEESMYYEHKKHDGSYPIIGVNTFRNPDAPKLAAAFRCSAHRRGEAKPDTPAA
jgi:methylmalonyl-CoA mutase